MGNDYAMISADSVIPRGDIPIYRMKNMLVSTQFREWLDNQIADGIKRGFVVVPNEVKLIGFINRKPGKEDKMASPGQLKIEHPCKVPWVPMDYKGYQMSSNKAGDGYLYFYVCPNCGIELTIHVDFKEAADGQ